MEVHSLHPLPPRPTTSWPRMGAERCHERSRLAHNSAKAELAEGELEGSSRLKAAGAGEDAGGILSGWLGAEAEEQLQAQARALVADTPLSNEVVRGGHADSSGASCATDLTAESSVDQVSRRACVCADGACVCAFSVLACAFPSSFHSSPPDPQPTSYCRVICHSLAEPFVLYHELCRAAPLQVAAVLLMMKHLMDPDDMDVEDDQGQAGQPVLQVSGSVWGHPGGPMLRGLVC